MLYKTILQQGVEALKTKNYISEDAYSDLTSVISAITKNSFTNLEIDNFTEQALNTSIVFDRLNRKIKTSTGATFPATVDTAKIDIGNATLKSLFLIEATDSTDIDVYMSYDNTTWFILDLENINIGVTKTNGFYLRVVFKADANAFKKITLCYENNF